MLRSAPCPLSTLQESMNTPMSRVVVRLGGTATRPSEGVTVEGSLEGRMPTCWHCWPLVVTGGQEGMGRRRPAFHSFIPFEFAANKQTLWACCFVLDESRSCPGIQDRWNEANRRCPPPHPATQRSTGKGSYLKSLKKLLSGSPFTPETQTIGRGLAFNNRQTVANVATSQV